MVRWTGCGATSSCCWMQVRGNRRVARFSTRAAIATTCVRPGEGCGAGVHVRCSRSSNNSRNAATEAVSHAGYPQVVHRIHTTAGMPFQSRLIPSTYLCLRSRHCSTSSTSTCKSCHLRSPSQAQPPFTHSPCPWSSSTSVPPAGGTQPGTWCHPLPAPPPHRQPLWHTLSPPSSGAAGQPLLGPASIPPQPHPPGQTTGRWQPRALEHTWGNSNKTQGPAVGAARWASEQLWLCAKLDCNKR
jgi:hypothetical protein